MGKLEIPEDLDNRLANWRDGIVIPQEQFKPKDWTKTAEAAVLMPLFVDEDGWHLLLTRRTDHVETHKGQVSFPGGARDPEDGDLVQTALREAWEEVGLAPQDVQVLGCLPPMALVSHFVVTPVAGMIPWPYPLKLSRDEVSRVFSIPLDWLADPANRYTLEHDHEGQRWPVLYYQPYDGEVLWGASAYMTSQLLHLITAA